MALGGHVRTDLVGLSGDQMDFQKRCALSFTERTVFCLDPDGSGGFGFRERNPVRFRIFHKVSVNVCTFLYGSGHKAPIIFPEGAVPEHGA